jgi:hypothetical protein
VKPNPNDFITAVTANKRYATEEHSLRFQGLEGLVIILRTLLLTANLWQGIGETVQNGASKRQSLSDPYSVIAALSYESRNSTVEIDSVNETEADNSQVVSPSNVPTTGSEVASPIAPDTVSAVGNFDRKQKIQEEVETGILKFNISDIWVKEYLEFNLGKQTFEFSTDELKLTKNQTIVLKKQGISRINTNDIYDISNKSDIILNIALSL